jgi:hypothetical protein
MLTSPAQKMLFVHVQKTGGRSVNKVLWRSFSDLTKIERRHSTYAEAVASHPEVADHFVFGFVRNPWDRLVSWYSMIAAAHETKRHVEHLKENAFWQAVRADFADFEDFIRRGVGDPDFRSKRYQRLRRPQTAYFADTDGRPRADFIGRTENLDDDLATALANFGIELERVPRINASSHAHYSDYYTPELRDIVAGVFADDLDRFGYTF